MNTDHQQPTYPPKPLPAKARHALSMGHSITVQYNRHLGTPNLVTIDAEHIQGVWDVLSAHHPDAIVAGTEPRDAWGTRGDRGESDPPEVQIALERGWAMEIEGDLEVLPGDQETVGQRLRAHEVADFWASTAKDFLRINVVLMGKESRLFGEQS